MFENVFISFILDGQFENGLEIICFSSEFGRHCPTGLLASVHTVRKSNADLILDSLSGTWFSSLKALAPPFLPLEISHPWAAEQGPAGHRGPFQPQTQVLWF